MNFLTDHFILLVIFQTSGAASYSKFVSREMSKAEALLKVCNQGLNVPVGTFFQILSQVGGQEDFENTIQLGST